MGLGVFEFKKHDLLKSSLKKTKNKKKLLTELQTQQYTIYIQGEEEMCREVVFNCFI